jgi:hypothetical protein
MSFGIPVRNGVGIGLKAYISVGTRSGPGGAVPGAPTIGTATVISATSASVTFTAPADPGLPAIITGYTVTSSPGGITATGSSSPITVTGLTTGTAYTFTVRATNATGTGPASAASNSVTPAVPYNINLLIIAGGGGWPPCRYRPSNFYILNIYRYSRRRRLWRL